MTNHLATAGGAEPGNGRSGSTATFGVRDLREEMGLNQLAFGELIGLANKASVSLLESGQREASPDVALEIERLSIRDGIARIDAGALSGVVRRSRAACPGGCGFEIPSHAPVATPAEGLRQ